MEVVPSDDAVVLEDDDEVELLVVALLQTKWRSWRLYC